MSTDRELAAVFHEVFYEVEQESSLYPFRDYISFDGSPMEYQDMMLLGIRKLKERGVINGASSETTEPPVEKPQV